MNTKPSPTDSPAITLKMPQRMLVVGSGTMGAGIAQIAAASGCFVHLHDQSPDAATRAIERITASLGRAQSKGHVTAQEVSKTLEHLTALPSLDDLATLPSPVDVALEAIYEDRQAKHDLFARLEKLLSPQTPLWTNASMIPIGSIAEGLQHPGRVVGTHFFNPVPRMKLVEVIASTHTQDAYVQHAMHVVTSWGKTPVLAPDTPGFIVNRVFDAIKRVALELLEQGTPASEIDKAIKLGLNFPMGPFEVMDLVGLDSTYRCLQTQAAAMNHNPDFGQTLPGLIEAGKLGKKSGSGFYEYPSGE